MKLSNKSKHKVPLQITADKREIRDFPQIAVGNFFYPRAVICNGDIGGVKNMGITLKQILDLVGKLDDSPGDDSLKKMLKRCARFEIMLKNV